MKYELGYELARFGRGVHRAAYRFLGAHPAADDASTVFRVWAPNARAVSVIGDFNDWSANQAVMTSLKSSGVWEVELRGVGRGALYKYAIETPAGELLEKADPVAFAAERPPKTASVVSGLDYVWNDATWMRERPSRQRREAPISVYEVHLGSWLGPDGPQTYRELAPELVEHVQRLGFTHVELLPVMEHPFDGSWGYQLTGYFAATSRFGTPEDFMFFVDTLHQAGIGILLDWVPAHFPFDAHGVACFDGTALYEHEDPREGYHPDWHTAIFNYGRHEVKSFLVSSALFWLDRFHIDGIRVDAVASMLYRDYSREDGAWIPNHLGGRENLEAIGFIRDLNVAISESFPDALSVAEESTAWPGVSKPTDEGGLGFSYKWDMGWMHDTLSYFSRESVHRAHHQEELTFRGLYRTHEHFMLPLSHDEVVHGKGALLSKMQGDVWQKFANMRLLLASMYGQPGKKLLFMGVELGCWDEWNHGRGLPWNLMDYPAHQGIAHLIADLNGLYRDLPALHEGDCHDEGYQWIGCSDAKASVLGYLRTGDRGVADPILVVLNHTPIVRENYSIGVPTAGRWRELLNTDASHYGGSGVGNAGWAEAQEHTYQGQPCQLTLTLPPLGALFLQPSGS